MKGHRFIVLVLVAALAITGGCATTGSTQYQKTSDDAGCLGGSPEECIASYTAGGAVAGAIIGGIAGALIGGGRGAGTGVAIGAAAGGASGFAYAWGKCFGCFSQLTSQPAAGYGDTAQQVRYNPSQGTAVKIQQSRLTPNAIKPGSTVNFNANYYVMTPNQQQAVPVTETRTLRRWDAEKNQMVDLGSVDQQITAAPGTRRADGKFDIPKDVEPGRYQIAFAVSSGGKTDVAQLPLTIQTAYLDNGERVLVARLGE